MLTTGLQRVVIRSSCFLLTVSALAVPALVAVADEIPKELITRATSGDAAAQFELGNALEKKLPNLGDEKTLEGQKIATEAISWWRKAAEQGNMEAEVALATCLTGGWGLPVPDGVEGAKWNRKAAEQGNGDAAFQLGMAYEDGNGVPMDGAEAVKWFRRAEDLGDDLAKGTAETMIGHIYAKGECVAKDDREAVKWYRKAAEHGIDLAQEKLGRAYLLGEGVTKDLEDAKKWLERAARNGNKKAQDELVKLTGEIIKSPIEELRDKAEKGDPKAQLSLAIAYARWKLKTADAWGLTIPQREPVRKDTAEAMKWLRKSADQGYPQAEYYMGYAYRDGFGVSEDKAESIKWFQNAANHGLPEAQDELGYVYYEGYEVPKDFAESAKWYQMAADKGDVRAQEKMGDLCLRGDDKNIYLPIPAERKTSAAEWYQKAANQYRSAAEHGDADAQYRFGELIEKVAKAKIKNYGNEEETRYSPDFREAAFWFMKAAYQGHSDAQIALSYIYLLGEGVEKSDVEGTAWEIVGAAGASEVLKDSELDQLKRDELEIGPDKMRLAKERAKEIAAEIAASNVKKDATMKSH